MNDVPRNTVLVGDALAKLTGLPDASVDCVVTSPPYFNLRRYGARGQLGLEASVGEWVDHLIAVCDEIARVLKPEGSLWLNLGDSYARREQHGARRKGLVLAPERLLLALANRGWLVRNKVVWAKSNPMPSSARDRLTCAWEPMYFLVRSPSYFFDLDAIRITHRSQRGKSRTIKIAKGPASWMGPLAGNQSGLARLKVAGLAGHPLGKNPSDHWVFATSNFRGGHHATFPSALVERPLLATCPERVCIRCTKAWRRQPIERRLGHLAVVGDLSPQCGCNVGYRCGLVLDPFMGSGTTGLVAEAHGRDWLGIELNPEFATMAEARIAAARGQPEQRAA